MLVWTALKTATKYFLATIHPNLLPHQLFCKAMWMNLPSLLYLGLCICVSPIIVCSASHVLLLEKNIQSFVCVGGGMFSRDRNVWGQTEKCMKKCMRWVTGVSWSGAETEMEKERDWRIAVVMVLTYIYECGPHAGAHCANVTVDQIS